MRGFVPAGIDLARLNRADQLLRQQWEDPEQRKGTDERGREDARQAVEPGQLRAGVHINQGAGQHADLAHPIERANLDRGQAHDQIDDEEGEQGHQAQGEQIERAVLRHAGIDRGEPVAEAALHPIAQQEA